ncbi:hypothetical protein QQP08_020267 [Theobroma cacao]|nr:hypothetical protein QQP08_020267 [Theobroma cacao]
MDIQQKLVQYRYHFTIAILASFIIAFLLYLATEVHGEKAGQGLMDYVAARPEHAEEAQKFE